MVTGKLSLPAHGGLNRDSLSQNGYGTPPTSGHNEMIAEKLLRVAAERNGETKSAKTVGTNLLDC